MVDLIHIHEDDWGMRNLHPVAAWDEAVADLEKGRAFSAAHCVADGIWSAIYMSQPPSADYSQAGLTFAATARVLEPILPRVAKFYATATGGFGREARDPYGTYEEESWCFGLGEHCYIKLDGKGELVERIWFELRTCDSGDVAALRAAIEALDRLVPSIVIDHWIDAAGRVGDVDFLDRYFAALASVRLQFEKRFGEADPEGEVA